MNKKNKNIIIFVLIFILAISLLCLGYLFHRHNKRIMSQIQREKYIQHQRIVRIGREEEQKKQYLKLVNINANSLKPLNIKTCDGFNQPMHPDVLYINAGFHGYKYWMAYTPYPYGNGSYENPCIAASNNGLSWITPNGLKNPIAPHPKDVKVGGHFSDTDIILDNNKLVVYYVYNKENVLGPSKFYRSISSNGIKWSKPQLIYKCKYPISGYSPAVIKDNGIYKMWYISESNVMSYVTSKNSTDWSKRKTCEINIPNWTIWHLNVIKSDIGYEGLLTARDNRAGYTALYYIKSTDGIVWSASKLPVIYPSAHGWDSQNIYRSSFVIKDGSYNVWYSGCDYNNKWGIGYTRGKTMASLSRIS
ncbi:hypothetical protein ACJDU8_21845 [Clostridium sp. WILCCON 0269]|uniref:Glycosyl hydrolase family 32 N-terminal domain-containing protein n=1 Tax=Candidatus Clostridium eludens TaxID=3381663 RepID=A0ABW8SR16_9CLOT